MKKLLKNRLALSTVVASLIVLVISVLLASVVVYFATNIVSTRAQQESLSLSDAHVWLNPAATTGQPTYSQTSLKIVNTGGRDVVITKIQVGGQDAAWSSWVNPTDDQQFVVYAEANTPVQSGMYFQNSLTIPATDPIDSPVSQTMSLLGSGTSEQYLFTAATTDLVLKSGFTILLYIVNPLSININDIGLTVSVTIYTAQAMYYQECNIQTSSG